MARTAQFLGRVLVTLVLFSGHLETLAAAGDAEWIKSSRLQGKVLSSSGDPLVGVPIRAERNTSANDTSVITINAYTNSQGHYAYRDLPAGIYKVYINTPGFEATAMQTVEVTDQGSEIQDIKLHPRQPTSADVTATELLNSLPGTEEQKASFSDCGNCHSLQFIWQAKGRTRDGWLSTIERMRVKDNNGVVHPLEMHKAILDRTRAANNKLADYIAENHGDALDFKLLPRPTGDVSTRLQITEYALRRGASIASSVVLRGDPRAPWLHDVMPDPNRGFVWFTDHFSNFLGRLDPITGEIVEFEFPQAKQGRLGGSHGIQIDKDGNIWIGVLWQGTMSKFDPRTGTFTHFTVEDKFVEYERTGIFGIDSSTGIISVASSQTNSLFRLEPKTGKFTRYALPAPGGIYGTVVDSKGLVYYAQFGSQTIGKFDPRTEKFTVWNTPSPNSRPRRADIDKQDRFWFAEFKAGNIGMLDPATETIREWPVVPGQRYVAPYDVSVDNYNNTVWTTDFTNNNRLYRLDLKTDAITEYLLPQDVEVRHLYVDGSKAPVTVWIPDYTPPARILRVQVW